MLIRNFSKRPTFKTMATIFCFFDAKNLILSEVVVYDSNHAKLYLQNLNHRKAPFGAFFMVTS